MNVPWVDPCAFSPSWQLARRKVRQNQACTEHNPSDWQLCPLVTVWLSPKLLYFTEIMIFYGHRFEDNCCILRVVVLQGDTAASFGEEMGGKKVALSFFPSLSHFPFPTSPFSIYFLLFISLFAFLVAKQSPHCGVRGRRAMLCHKHSCAEPGHISHLTEITQFSNQVWKSKHSGAGKWGGGRASEGILRTWSLFIAAWWLAVLMARYVGPRGVVKKPSWAWKGEKCQRQQGWRWFLKQARCRCTNSTASPTIHIPDIGTCGWIFLWIFTPKGVNASKNVGNPEKEKKKKVFSAPGRIQSEKLYPKELVMHYLMKCFFLGKTGKMLPKASFAIADACQDTQGLKILENEKENRISCVNSMLSSFVSNHKKMPWWFDFFWTDWGTQLKTKNYWSVYLFIYFFTIRDAH